MLLFEPGAPVRKTRAAEPNAPVRKTRAAEPNTPVRKTRAAFVTGIAATLLLWKMTPASFHPGAASPALYRLTQPWVALHYFKSFFLPTELSADTDWAYVASPSSGHAIAGYLFVSALLAAALYAARRTRARPIAFGLLWFLLALLPTSLAPLAEVTNDHRMFFPFVGLALAVFWSLRLLVIARPRLARAAVAAMLAVLAAAAIGAHARNVVWRSDESLWRDVTLKSPRNGRGLMNYGLTFQSRGDYVTALAYFERALVYCPNYWPLEVNLGIANGGLDRGRTAERHFQRALLLAPDLQDPYFYYARWLLDRSRRYYQAGRYADSIAAARQALLLRPDDLEAHNNITAASLAWVVSRK